MKINKFVVFLVLLALSVQLVIAGTVTRSVSSVSPLAGGTLTVSLAVAPGTGETYYAIDEVYPSGWTFSKVSSTDCSENSGHIKCILIQNAAQTTYSYDIVVPSTATSGTFSGTYAFEGGTETTISGSNYVSVSTSVSLCGDGKVDTTEECDDSNAVSNDGCSSLCTVESGFSCSGEPSVCQTISTATCGNELVENPEICDGDALTGQTCVGEGFVSGTIKCGSDCMSLDTSGCSSTSTPTVTCGNNIIEGSEVCDGTALGGKTCVSQGFTSGTLSCKSDCSAFETSQCVVSTTSTKLQTLLDSIKNILSNTTTSKLQKISAIASALSTYFG